MISRPPRPPLKILTKRLLSLKVVVNTKIVLVMISYPVPGPVLASKGDELFGFKN